MPSKLPKGVVYNAAAGKPTHKKKNISLEKKLKQKKKYQNVKL